MLNKCVVSLKKMVGFRQLVEIVDLILDVTVRRRVNDEETGSCGSFRWPTIGESIASQARRLCHEVVPFRDARGARSRNSVMFDSGFVITQLFK